MTATFWSWAQLHPVLTFFLLFFAIWAVAAVLTGPPVLVVVKQ